MSFGDVKINITPVHDARLWRAVATEVEDGFEERGIAFALCESVPLVLIVEPLQIAIHLWPDRMEIKAVNQNGRDGQGRPTVHHIEFEAAIVGDSDENSQAWDCIIEAFRGLKLKPLDNKGR